MKIRMQMVALCAVVVAGCSSGSESVIQASQVGLADASPEGDIPLTGTVSLTDNAADQVKQIMSDNELWADSHLRIAVKQHDPGCFEYDLRFADDADPVADAIVLSRGLKIAVDKTSMLFLDGTVVDFEADGSDGTGFRFHNPNAAEE